MSTFIHSAAMTLLSKTLQTLLYKYLSDVDVEGVNLPLYGSDGHSGWGVRLSNVKLRTGAKLMDLPGQAPSQIRKTKQRQRLMRKRERRKQQRQRAAEEERKRHEQQQQHAAAAVAAAEKKAATTTASEMSRVDAPSSKPTAETAAVSPPPSVPPPARTSSYYSWFSWGSRSNDDIVEDETPPPPLLPPPLLPSLSTDHAIPALAAPTDSQRPDYEEEQQEEEEQPDPLMGFVTHHPEDPRDETSFRTDDDDGFDEDVDHDDNSDSDDEDDVAHDHLPMTLSIGNMGCIGTLDVRLIGTDIHVFIEDAFLIVEAVRVRKEPEPNDGGGGGGGGGTTDAASIMSNKSKDGSMKDTSQHSPPRKKTSSSTGGNTPSKRASASSVPSTPAPKPEPKTVADRILAQNALARLISNIPHLFLRDIRVRFIIRDEEPSRDNMDDTVVELCCEFLSVNDGEDVMAAE